MKYYDYRKIMDNKTIGANDLFHALNKIDLAKVQIEQKMLDLQRKLSQQFDFESDLKSLKTKED